MKLLEKIIMKLLGKITFMKLLNFKQIFNFKEMLMTVVYEGKIKLNHV